jgi:flagellar capping protein FliD
VTTDAGGNLLLSDKIAGTSRMTVSAMTIGTTDHTISISQVGAEGAGVLSVGKDAYYSIEGLFMQSAANTASEFISGVSFSFLAVAPEGAVTVGLSRDFDAIRKKFKDLIDSYNALSSYARDAGKSADPNNENSTDGDLAGDMTVRSIVNAVRDTFRQQYDKLNRDLTSFTMVGLKSDSKTGELSIDEKKFNSAIGKDLNAVQQLFVTMGVSENANVALGRNTSETKAGRYVLEEVDPTHMRLRQENGTEWYTSDARVGDIVTFGAGPAKGLSISAASGVVSGPVTFNFQKGLSMVLDEAIAKLTDTREGVVSLWRKAWSGQTTGSIH